MKPLIYNPWDFVGKFLRNKRNTAALQYSHGRLLDVSCGDNSLVNLHGNGIGVDVMSYSKTTVIVETTSNLPFPNDYFDTVTNLASLNYAEDALLTLKEMKRVLKKDGNLLISMPNVRALKIWQKFRDKKKSKVGIKESTLLSLIEKTGLRVKKRNKFLLGLNTLFIIQKIEN